MQRGRKEVFFWSGDFELNSEDILLQAGRAQLIKIREVSCVDRKPLSCCTFVMPAYVSSLQGMWDFCSS